MERIKVNIDGMGCGHCVSAVAAALREVKGVEVENVAVGNAIVKVDSAVAGPDDVTRAIEQAGYTPKSVEYA